MYCNGDTSGRHLEGSIVYARSRTFLGNRYPSSTDDREHSGKMVVKDAKKKYEGLNVHDFRRSVVRNLTRSGV